MPRVFVDLLSYTGTKGGMETYTRELYRALGSIDSPWEFVGYVSREGAELDLSWFPGSIARSGISGENRFHWAWGELTQVARAARRAGADLIHSPATLGPRRSSVPTVVTMHDMLYWSHPEYMSTPLYTRPVRWMEQAAAANAARIVTISPDSAAEIRKYLGVEGDRLDVIPLAGGDPPVVDRSKADAGAPMILAMGNRRPHKNWQALVHAIALIDREKRPQLVITGGRGEDPLAPLVERLDVAANVTLEGWVTEDEVLALYERATALAIPSYAEGFSLPALESMGAGIPTLLSDIGVHRYVAGDAAAYFAPDDHRQLADLISRVIDDAPFRQHLVQSGRARAAEFTWSRTARETSESFARALAAQPTRRRG